MYIAVEGATDIPVAERLIKHVGLQPLPAITARSAAKLDQRFKEVNRSGRALNWFVLRDLDAVACPPELLHKLLAGVALTERVCVRVPVPETESWSLADTEGFAGTFSVGPSRMVASPDELTDPKRHVVEVCRHARSRAVRNNVPPRPGSGRSVGAEYASRIIGLRPTFMEHRERGNAVAQSRPCPLGPSQSYRAGRPEMSATAP